MRLLATGKGGKSGAWQIRGVQLVGDAVANAPIHVLKDSDVIVAVKRLNPELLAKIRKAGVPWVWDLVDFYPQPACTNWCKSKAIHWVRTQILEAAPNGVIFPNKRMQDDCRIPIPSTVIYHHHWPNMRVNPIREHIKVVGYEGAQKYLGRWGDIVQRECDRRGWEFSVNDYDHAAMDICIAFRDDAYNGYVQRSWKSNVKLSNCHGSGTPFVGPPECGYTETQTGHEYWVDNQKNLAVAFDQLEPYAERLEIRKNFLNAAISVGDCRAQLEEFVSAL